MQKLLRPQKPQKLLNLLRPKSEDIQQSPAQEIPLSNAQNDDSIDTGLDLLPAPQSPFEKFTKIQSPKEIGQYYHSPYFLVSAQIIISLTLIAFIVITILNVSTNKSLDKKKVSIFGKIQQLESSNESFLNLKEISDKIAIHKTYKSEFIPISPLLELFKEDLPDFEYRSFSLNVRSVSITAQTGSPLAFSLLTNKYLTSGLVSQVVLKSASLDNLSQKYNLTLEVALK